MCPAALAGWRGISLRVNEAQWNVAAVVMIKCQISIAGEAGRTVIWEPAEVQGTAEVREAKRARSQRRKRGEAGEGRAERKGGASWAEAAARRGFRGAGLSVRSCACVMLFRAVCYGGSRTL